MNAKKILFGIMKFALLVLSIIFFPLGLFLLGYIIGSRKRVKTMKEDQRNPAKIVEEILKEPSEETSDRIVL